MKVRNKSENTRYANHLDIAIDQIAQAIDSITYTAYPEINQKLIEKLEETLDTLTEATHACIFKP